MFLFLMGATSVCGVEGAECERDRDCDDDEECDDGECVDIDPGEGEGEGGEGEGEGGEGEGEGGEGEGEGEPNPFDGPDLCGVHSGAGDGCDCGCGVVDSDCPSSSSSSCFVDWCPPGSPAETTNNAVCAFHDAFDSLHVVVVGEPGTHLRIKPDGGDWCTADFAGSELRTDNATIDRGYRIDETNLGVVDDLADDDATFQLAVENAGETDLDFQIYVLHEERNISGTTTGYGLYAAGVGTVFADSLLVVYGVAVSGNSIDGINVEVSDIGGALSTCP
jgi:hypothetical protein